MKGRNQFGSATWFLTDLHEGSTRRASAVYCKMRSLSLHNNTDRIRFPPPDSQNCMAFAGILHICIFQFLPIWLKLAKPAEELLGTAKQASMSLSVGMLCECTDFVSLRSPRKIHYLKKLV